MKDWEYIANFAGRRAPSFRPGLKNEAEKIMTPRMNQHGPVTFHPYFYALLRLHTSTRTQPETVIETGTRYGLSSFAACSALGFGRRGHVWTCDVMYPNHNTAQMEIKKLLDVDFWAGWEYLGEPSARALPTFAKANPVWDVFLHDSDHSAKNMAWELDFAWEHIPAGGLMIVDDYDWPAKKEGDDVFDKFCTRIERDFHTISTAAVIEK